MTITQLTTLLLLSILTVTQAQLDETKLRPGVYVRNETSTALPLKSIQYTARIDEYISEVKLVQEYFNYYDQEIPRRHR
jgi:hypothetical protein